MATWHQQKAGLAGLYQAPDNVFRVVNNPPNRMASAVDFYSLADAKRLAAKQPHSVIVRGRRRLPLNIERIRDGNGYRYRGYSKDGWACRIYRSGDRWACSSLGGTYVGTANTLAELSAKLAATETKGD